MIIWDASTFELCLKEPELILELLIISKGLEEDFDWDKFKSLFGRGGDAKAADGVEVNLKPNIDMKDMLAQAGASQKEI